MEEFIISPKEFYFLCLGMGISGIYGVEDPFKEGNISDIPYEVSKVQSSLERKGYMESDFDGNTTIQEELLAYIYACAKCSKILFMVNAYKTGETNSVIYYVLGEKAIKSTKKNGMYHLSNVSLDNIAEQLMSQIAYEDAKNVPGFEQVIIPKAQFEKIKALKNKKELAQRELAKYFDKKIGDIVLEALNQKQNFCSLMSVDYTRSDSELSSLMFISGEGMNLKLQPTVVDLRTCIEFQMISPKEIISSIKKCIANVIL